MNPPRSLNRLAETQPRVAVIGGGPAGLMAAGTVAAAGVKVTVHDRMPSVGRKFLLAGRGGLNLTYDEPLPRFIGRYGAGAERVAACVAAFPPEALVAWCHGLGQATFTGSSRRVFPVAMKSSPLLRAWLARLRQQGVQFRTGAEWTGWQADAPAFADGSVAAADAVVLALGGASWPRLGSDGGWTRNLPGIAIAPLRPANCGFAVAWSAPFQQRCTGLPLKRIAVAFAGRSVRGEAVITKAGIEGGPVYALSAAIRDAGPAPVIRLDLRPDLTAAALAQRLAAPRRGQSLSTWLRKAAGLSPVAIGLVQEAMHAVMPRVEPDLAALIKALPLTLGEPSPIARAISTAGGIAWSELDERLMLRRRTGVFAAGEMLDWEAPTGGYLLQACFSTGHAAGRGVLGWLAERGVLGRLGERTP